MHFNCMVKSSGQIKGRENRFIWCLYVCVSVCAQVTGREKQMWEVCFVSRLTWFQDEGIQRAIRTWRFHRGERIKSQFCSLVTVCVTHTPLCSLQQEQFLVVLSMLVLRSVLFALPSLTTRKQLLWTWHSLHLHAPCSLSILHTNATTFYSVNFILTFFFLYDFFNTSSLQLRDMEHKPSDCRQC